MIAYILLTLLLAPISPFIRDTMSGWLNIFRLCHSRKSVCESVKFLSNKTWFLALFVRFWCNVLVFGNLCRVRIHHYFYLCIFEIHCYLQNKNTSSGCFRFRWQNCLRGQPSLLWETRKSLWTIIHRLWARSMIDKRQLNYKNARSVKTSAELLSFQNCWILAFQRSNSFSRLSEINS